MCGFNLILNRTRTAAVVPPATSPSSINGRTPLTGANLNRLNDAALQRVIDLLNAQGARSLRQNALLDAARQLQDNRRVTGRTFPQPGITVDPALQPQYPRLNAIHDVLLDIAAAQSKGVQSLLDSADDTTPTAPDKLIEKLIELGRVDKRLIEIGGKLIDARSTNRNAEGDPRRVTPEPGLTIQEAIKREDGLKPGRPLFPK